MKTLTIHEAQGQLAQLIAAAHAGESVVLTDGERRVVLEPRTAPDLEEDSPELEAELLKAAGSPVTPYSREEMRERLMHGARDLPQRLVE